MNGTVRVLAPVSVAMYLHLTPKIFGDNILNFLDGNPIKRMKPWFRGFKGKVFEQDDDSWMTQGSVERHWKNS